MKSYVVYTKYENSKITDIAFVCDNFSWFFFLLTPFALLTNKLFKPFFILIALSLLLVELISYSMISSDALLFLYITFALYCGLMNDELIREKLENSGYNNIDIILANSLEEAEHRYRTTQ